MVQHLAFSKGNVVKPELHQVIEPAHAVLLTAFGKLVDYLQKRQVIPEGEFAEILAAQADALPPQCRTLLEELSNLLRPTSRRMRLYVRDDEEGGD